MFNIVWYMNIFELQESRELTVLWIAFFYVPSNLKIIFLVLHCNCVNTEH